MQPCSASREETRGRHQRVPPRLILDEAVEARGFVMTIYRLMQNTPMEPEDLKRLAAAYESALVTLALTVRETR